MQKDKVNLKTTNSYTFYTQLEINSTHVLLIKDIYEKIGIVKAVQVFRAIYNTSLKDSKSIVEEILDKEGVRKPFV